MSTTTSFGRGAPGVYEVYQMTVAKKAEPAMSITPARNIAVSNRVISQLLRMARLNYWMCRMSIGSKS